MTVMSGHRCRWLLHLTSQVGFRNLLSVRIPIALFASENWSHSHARPAVSPLRYEVEYES